MVRKNGGYLGANDRFVDIRVYDAVDPIAELERLLALHKLHFFPSEPPDLLPITPAIVAQLEPILLAEPVNQPREVAREAAGIGDARPSSRRCATSCTGRITTCGCGWTARSIGWCCEDILKKRKT